MWTGDRPRSWSFGPLNVSVPGVRPARIHENLREGLTDA
ncbi:hypothetical protein STTU_0224 [Streptomyces sp. Tu6071]|nr:hypothetical protein STTU_0224 [Streptomyces sp. Tu6071]